MSSVVWFVVIQGQKVLEYATALTNRLVASGECQHSWLYHAGFLCVYPKTGPPDQSQNIAEGRFGCEVGFLRMECTAGFDLFTGLGNPTRNITYELFDTITMVPGAEEIGITETSTWYNTQAHISKLGFRFKSSADPLAPWAYFKPLIFVDAVFSPFRPGYWSVTDRTRINLGSRLIDDLFDSGSITQLDAADPNTMGCLSDTYPGNGDFEVAYLLHDYMADADDFWTSVMDPSMTLGSLFSENPTGTVLNIEKIERMWKLQATDYIGTVLANTTTGDTTNPLYSLFSNPDPDVNKKMILRGLVLAGESYKEIMDYPGQSSVNFRADTRDSLLLQLKTAQEAAAASTHNVFYTLGEVRDELTASNTKLTSMTTQLSSLALSSVKNDDLLAKLDSVIGEMQEASASGLVNSDIIGALTGIKESIQAISAVLPVEAVDAIIAGNSIESLLEQFGPDILSQVGNIAALRKGVPTAAESASIVSRLKAGEKVDTIFRDYSSLTTQEAANLLFIDKWFKAKAYP